MVQGLKADAVAIGTQSWSPMSLQQVSVGVSVMPVNHCLRAFKANNEAPHPAHLHATRTARISS
jgi:hypothetical protein